MLSAQAPGHDEHKAGQMDLNIVSVEQRDAAFAASAAQKDGLRFAQVVTAQHAPQLFGQSASNADEPAKSTY